MIEKWEAGSSTELSRKNFNIESTLENDATASLSDDSDADESSDIGDEDSISH